MLVESSGLPAGTNNSISSESNKEKRLTKEIPGTETEETEVYLPGAGIAGSGLLATGRILTHFSWAIFHEPWLVRGRETGTWLVVIARFWFVAGTECETGEMGEFWFLANEVSLLARTEGPEIWV